MSKHRQKRKKTGQAVLTKPASLALLCLAGAVSTPPVQASVSGIITGSQGGDGGNGLRGETGGHGTLTLNNSTLHADSLVLGGNSGLAGKDAAGQTDLSVTGGSGGNGGHAGNGLLVVKSGLLNVSAPVI